MRDEKKDTFVDTLRQEYDDYDDDDEDDVDEFFGNQSSDEEEYDDNGQHTSISLTDVEQNFSPSLSLSKYESQSQERSFHNLGYHEAYDEYKESKLQLGFEEGFITNMDRAVAIGKLLGKCVFIDHYQQQHNENHDDADTPERTENQMRQGYGTSLVRHYLEKEQVKDGTNCDLKNELSKDLEHKLNEILRVKEEKNPHIADSDE